MDQVDEEERILTADEDRLLSAVGYLVMRWNYAEYFARQILRQYISGGSLYDGAHLKLTKRRAFDIEQELGKVALPKWDEPGKSFLEQLIAAFSSGRNHRNRIVHGINDTFPANEVYPAQVWLTSFRREGEKYKSFVDLEIILRTAHHFHDLAMFAREVCLTFAPDGSFAFNADGSRVMPSLPNMVHPLPDIEFLRTWAIGRVDP